MISLLRRTFVAETFDETKALLEALVGEAPNATLRLVVRPPVRIPSLGVEIALVRDVVATMVRAADADAYAVSWQPSDDGPFPHFAGTLTLAEVDGTHLALAGDYELPDERILVRDAFLAHRIAQAIAGELLARIAAAFEHRSRTAAAAHDATTDGASS